MPFNTWRRKKAYGKLQLFFFLLMLKFWWIYVEIKISYDKSILKKSNKNHEIDLSEMKC